MCGIFGVVGPGIIRQDLQVFEELGIVTQIRGLHSSGVYQTCSLNNKHECHFVTGDTFSESLVYADSPKDLMRNCACDLVIGHVRHRTRGSYGAANAQPIDTGRYVVVHNGTVTNKKYEDEKMSDSFLMAKDIEERGFQDVLNDLEEKSAFVLIVWDKKEKKFYFTSNGKRPLNFAASKKRNVLFFASESMSLRWILQRNDIEYHDIYPLLPKEVFELDVRKVSVGNPYSGWSKSNIIYPKTEPPKVLDVAKEEETKVVIKKEVKTKTNFRDFYISCNCGKQRANSLLMSSYIRRGKAPGLEFDEKTHNFKCTSMCKGTK